jgi:hypothetical protein
MTNRDGVVSYQDFFDNEAYDSLALDYVQRFSGTGRRTRKDVRVSARLRNAARSAV